MTIKKRCLLWDWTNTDGPGHQGVPWAMDVVRFNGPLSSVSNWNTWSPPELKDRAPFRPMVHLEAQLSGDDWKRIQSTNQPIIHFFNEPERAGITPQHAADLWNRQMLPLRSQKGKKLVSPSCASDRAGQDWIHAWMKLVSSNPPDYLGLHYYGTDGDAAIRYLESMHQHHPHIPVIVSEFASISRQYNDVLGFTVQLANWMDRTSWIFEYALFGCMRELADGFVSPEARLMNPDGSFTDLMWKYMSDQPMHF
jgi:Glycosyl hydrolase catalytic core